MSSSVLGAVPNLQLNSEEQPQRSSSREQPPVSSRSTSPSEDPVSSTLLAASSASRNVVVSPPPKELSGEVHLESSTSEPESEPTDASLEGANGALAAPSLQVPTTAQSTPSPPSTEELTLGEPPPPAVDHPPGWKAATTIATTLTLTLPLQSLTDKNDKVGDGGALEKALPWKPCHVHRPTLSELRTQSFSDYVRHTVLKRARPPLEEGSDSEDEGETPDDDEEACHFDHGMAKIVLPEGLLSLKGIAGDQTARGPAWEAGTPLGDKSIGSPMHQHLRGLAGTYSYTLMDQPARTVAEFREQADAYRDDLLPPRLRAKAKGGGASDGVAELERHFWKRLGPTMPPPTYGADQEGTLFHDDDAATGWSLGHLDSCLHVLGGRVPGVTSPYLYFGMWASVFCAHTEDMNLLSINYLHAGAPKIWYGVSSKYAARFQALASACFCLEKCPEFLRHKQSLISPHVLQKAGIPFTFAVQFPGEAMVTFPGAYHFGFNSGFNVAEATNFGVPEWIPFGRRARVCLCRPDSVRIDMDQFCRLLDVYTASQKARRRGARLSWKAWGDRRHPPQQAPRADEGEDDYGYGTAASPEEPDSESPAVASPHSDAKLKSKKSNAKKRQLSEQQRKGEFWVEVMKPVARKSTSASKAAAASATAKKSKSKKGRQSLSKPALEAEVWHLARPVFRKKLVPEARVLVILPATELGRTGRDPRGARADGDDSGDDGGMASDPEDDPGDEECFAGRVAEVTDDHVRVRFDGLSRAEDVWMHQGSPKLFLDGGRWSDDDTAAAKAVPALHYWHEMDSKRRCVAG